MEAPADSAPEAQDQETPTSPPLQPIQFVSDSEDDQIAEGMELPSPPENPTCVKKTFAKIKYQYEVNIDPPEQDDKVKRDIMRYIGDNLKMEYKFNDTSFFAFSPMIATSEEGDGNFPLEENPNPCSFSVEGIKTSENWDSGKYETNMTIQLKKRRRALEVVPSDEPEQDERVQDQPNYDEVTETEMAGGPYNFDEFVQENKFLFIALGMVLALLVASWTGWI